MNVDTNIEDLNTNDSETVILDQLVTAMSENYATLQSLVRSRLAMSSAGEWLFHPSSTLPLLPDYFTLNSIGRTRWERRVNQVSSHWFVKFWYRSVWPKILKTILSRAKSGFFERILTTLPSDPQTESLKSCFYSTLESQLSQFWPELPQCAFSELYVYLYRSFSNVVQLASGRNDFFASEKADQNQRCLHLASDIAEELKSHKYRLEILFYMSCRANWIDNSDADWALFLRGFPEEVNDLLDEGTAIKTNINYNPLYHFSAVKERFTAGDMSVLYELDNSGEVVFDLLLIEYLLERKCTITVCMKSEPILNDVTLSDFQLLIENPFFEFVRQAMEEGRLTLVDTGPSLPGKLIYQAPESYRNAYKKATFHIIKGQGNFQTMPMGRMVRKRFVPYIYQKPILYLMGVKAPLIQSILTQLFHASSGLDLGTMVACYFQSRNHKTYPKSFAHKLNRNTSVIN